MHPNISAIEGSSQADPLQTAVQTQLLRKSMDLQKAQVLDLLPKSGRSELGTRLDVIA
ncbi:MAG TPA: hypothetical protein PKO15_04410 [Fibrobacteria bacterium]|nr:hypothetical protein [Fibrobacteria bacterium]HOX51356.1 hypothetical protein [Fibrobacteria bacterium]